jgi:outer membrane protein TolC
MIKKSFLCLLLVFTLNTIVLADEQDISNHYEDIKHIEFNLPKNLIPGLQEINQSLSMDKTITIGIEKNLGLQVVEAEIMVQRKMLEEAQAKRWPVISIGSLSFLRGGNSQTLMTPDMMMNTVDTTFFEDLNLTGRIPLFTGGRIKNSINAAQASLEGSEKSLKQAIVDTAFQIKEAYLTAQLSVAEHLVHQQHLMSQETLLKNSEARYKVGRGLKADVLRIKAEVADAEKLLNDQHVKLNNAMYELKSVMGIDLGSGIKVTDNLEMHLWTGSNELALLTHQALTNYPKILEMEKQIEEAGYQIRIAKSQYLPQVYGQVTGNLRFPDRPEMMGDGVITMVTVSLPLFDKNRSAEVARSLANLNKAKQTLKALQIEIGKKVAQVWNELIFAKENVTLLEASVEQSKEDLRLIQRRYEAGRAIVVEVQDAEWQLRQSQLDKTLTIFNYEMAKAKLLQALGKI